VTDRWVEPERVHCTECGAANRPGGTRCFLCGHPLHLDAGPIPRPAEGQSTPAPRAEVAVGHTFSLASLVLVIALLAVCLGVGHEAPGLGIVLALVSAPALFHTTARAIRSKAGGRPMSATMKVRVFLASLAAVVLISLSAIIAFVATCFPIGLVSLGVNFQAGMFVAMIVGGIAAVAAPILTYRLIRRLRDPGAGDEAARPHAAGDDPEPLP
jgi:hypothetical protein